MTKADARVHAMNEAEVRDDAAFVLYWMQSSQRAHDNAALALAVRRADALSLPLIAAFVVDDDYPEASERPFAFMLEGLGETSATLAEHGIRLIGRRGDPVEAIVELAEQAALVVTDTAYLQPARGWRDDLAKRLHIPLLRVESDVAVPVELASDKREYAARTIRKKINRHRDDCLQRVGLRAPDKSSLSLGVSDECDLSDPEALLAALDIDRSVPRVVRFKGGPSEAGKRLTRFLRQSLDGYAARDPEPHTRDSSELGPYLHFGQIGIVEIADKVDSASSGSDEDKEAFLEELIVRRELARNYTWFTEDYDRFAELPDWAITTLAEHRDDERPARYTRDELDSAATDDPHWNAAMLEIKHTGYLHNHLRMYWGKQVINWCNTPEYAYRTLLWLNNRYFLDGRDPNSYANVAWVFGLHDRAWTERDVFGKVRYMNANGLERKIDTDAWHDAVRERLAEEGVQAPDTFAADDA